MECFSLLLRLMVIFNVVLKIVSGDPEQDESTSFKKDLINVSSNQPINLKPPNLPLLNPNSLTNVLFSSKKFDQSHSRLNSLENENSEANVSSSNNPERLSNEEGLLENINSSTSSQLKSKRSHRTPNQSAQTVKGRYLYTGNRGYNLQTYRHSADGVSPSQLQFSAYPSSSWIPITSQLNGRQYYIVPLYPHSFQNQNFDMTSLIPVFSSSGNRNYVGNTGYTTGSRSNLNSYSRTYPSTASATWYDRNNDNIVYQNQNRIYRTRSGRPVLNSQNGVMPSVNNRNTYEYTGYSYSPATQSSNNMYGNSRTRYYSYSKRNTENSE